MPTRNRPVSRRRSFIAPLLAALAAVTSTSSGMDSGQVVIEGLPTIVSSRGVAPQDALTPPWHGNMRSAECCPRCAPPTMFHADPCDQLGWGRRFHPDCVCAPPMFPRLHALWNEGQMPTPRPPALPRCHQCGAIIEGGF